MFGRFAKPTGERALLCFSLVTLGGVPVQPEFDTRSVTQLKARLKGLETSHVVTVQIQTMFESFSERDERTIEKLIAMHQNFRETIQKQIAVKSPESKTGHAETSPAARAETHQQGARP